MAIYHFSAKVISRANGSSALAAAAYRSASRLNDERLGRHHDFTNKAGVVHSEVLLPEGAPARWRDRETLWNEVEAGERRRDAQLAREVEFAIPREINQAEGIQLARDFVQRAFVDRGMVADLNVHWDVAADGTPKPHAHVMLTMREASPEGFGQKARAWNRTELLVSWREAWADHVNARLAALDIDAAVDHRSLKDQGIDLEPQNKVGAAASGRAERGELAERLAEHREIARRNGEVLAATPSVGLDAISRQQSTFTDHDLMRFAHRHTDDAEQFQRALSAMRTSPERVALGKDGAGRERFTTRDMLAVEQRLEDAAERLAGRSGHGVDGAGPYGRAAALGSEQAAALAHVTSGHDLALVVGYAGSGKSAMLGAARDAWEAQGLTVCGAALSGIAGESLEGGSGIRSRTLASLEHSWANDRDRLGPNDVLVVDEAGMVGSRQMERVLGAAERAGAKVVLVGDVEQLQAIEAGAAFRALAERHGAAEITEVRRQTADWQRQATREFATGRTSQALERYAEQGAVVEHATRAEARAGVVAGWDQARAAHPDARQIILAHTRADVAELNGLARQRLRASGHLGEDHLIETERGERAFAVGDRVMFLRNERSLGVKNGSLGVVEQIEGGSLAVRLDGPDARVIAFSTWAYAHIDHGYAATIHKSQGVTVDRAHLLATGGLDRHATYVAMTRHRTEAILHYAREDFRSRGELTSTLSRERPKDTTLDYLDRYAARRGLEPEGPATRRADRFVAAWNEAKRQAARAGDDVAAQRAADRFFGALAVQLHRDPELRQALASRRSELGLERGRPQRRLGDDLLRAVGRDRGLDRER
ncbi:Ti-type conjugative transfer relaxase TraA [Phenylobacterium soli]|uniref:Ti-type conjugative transfer relaxase TraA n=1 Tax=Phenylobacterium soli TaxID=2170551 RepID=A0A328AH67_9CAUL|nr:Ti-type conjugative transfer relaxase TraA [Phenylobacterium soli]RAK54090.1 Ti-type conjugative transfer relaxase TraA [Phenylobacterium soli]